MNQHVADLFSSFLSFEKLTLVAEQNAKNEKFSSFENPFVYLFVDLLWQHSQLQFLFQKVSSNNPKPGWSTGLQLYSQSADIPFVSYITISQP